MESVINLYEMVRHSLRVIKLQEIWIQDAKLYIAMLETELKQRKEKQNV